MRSGAGVVGVWWRWLVGGGSYGRSIRRGMPQHRQFGHHVAAAVCGVRGAITRLGSSHISPTFLLSWRLFFW